MSQLLEFVAAVIKALPGEISHGVQQGWIENPKALQKALWEALVPPVVFKVIAGFDRDMRKEGWTLEKDSSVQTGEFQQELVKFLKEMADEYIDGDELLKCSKELGAETGHRHAEAMLREADKIPVEWRQYVLVFADTIWEDPSGCLYVACLEWDDHRWALGFYDLDNSFDRRFRLVRSRKYLKP